MITLNYADGRSLYEQIRDSLKELIVSGVVKAGEQLPSVRELSVTLTVNPNTVQRAYRELEEEGYCYSIPGKGSFVSQGREHRKSEKTEELYRTLTSAAKELAFLGESEKSLVNVIRHIYEEQEESET